MKINAIAIDDEPLALDIIKDYCSKVPYLNLIETFDNGLKALDFIHDNNIDLIFLDIQMEQLTGIQLLNVLKKKHFVIFTTAYDSYALQGFELDVTDYLLKPISFERFIKAVDKVFEKIQLETNHKPEIKTVVNNNSDDYIFVKTEFRFERIHLKEILYIEGMGDYLRIVTASKRIMTLLNFKRIEEMLPDNQFFRVHKSYIVALDKIENIERNHIKINDMSIPISETYKKPFLDFLEKKKIV